MTQKLWYAIELFGVLIVAFLLTAWMTWPFPVKIGSHSPESLDSLLNAYVHAWGTHALLWHPAALFDANIFYPAKNTLALSENLLGNQIFFAPVYLATGNPNLGNNAVALLSFVLCVPAMYLLVRWATGSVWAGLIAGVVFAFAPARISQLAHGHIQLLSSQWLPLIVLFLYRLVLRRTMGHLIGFSGFVLLQILCSLYLGYFALLLAAGYLVAIVSTRPSLLDRCIASRLFLAAVVVAGLLYPLMRPYQRLRSSGVVRQDYGLQVSASAGALSSYLNTKNTDGHPYHNFLERFHSLEYDWEKQLFVGFLPVGLALLGIGAACWSALIDSGRFGSETEESRPPGFIFGSLLVTASAYVLSLGPVLRVDDAPTHLRLPFFYLCEWVPGFSSFRLPARFGLLVMFGVGILAAFGFASLIRKMDSYRMLRSGWVKAALTVVVLFGICLEYRYAPFAPQLAMSPTNLSPEYKWLAGQPVEATLELPVVFRDGFPDPWQEAPRVYASAFHWHPIVNGYSGYSPTSASSMYRLAAEMPSAEAANILRGMGVRYVLLHTDQMSPPNLSSWASDQPAEHIRKIAQFGPTTVFELYSSDCRIGTRNIEMLELQAPEVSPAGRGFPLEISVQAGQTCWADARAAGEQRVIAEWRNQASGRTSRTSSEINWPVYLRAHERATLRGFVPAPKEPGAYTIIAKLANQDIDLPPRQITLHR